MNTFRINTLMERMVPDDMTGALDVAYMGNLSETVQYSTGKGAYAMIIPVCSKPSLVQSPVVKKRIQRGYGLLGVCILVLVSGWC